MGLLLRCVFTAPLDHGLTDDHRHLQANHPHLRLIIEPHTARDHPDLTKDCILVQPEDERLLALHSNLVITLGGDGTILHVSNLFGEGECPPVLSFSMGSLGFLLPFRKCFTVCIIAQETVSIDADVRL